MAIDDIKYEHTTRIIQRCKICGEIPSIHKAFDDHMYKIECADCARGTGSWSDFEDALKRWDTINVEFVRPVHITEKETISYFKTRLLMLDRWLERQPPVLKVDSYLEERNAIMMALYVLEKSSISYDIKYMPRRSGRYPWGKDESGRYIGHTNEHH